MKGYFGIGCFGMKTDMNYGSLFRTAQIFGADFIFLIGPRFKKQSTDTVASYRNMPLYEFKTFEEFNDHRPYDCKLIGVELTESARKIETFNHPKQAIYLLGAEDHGLPKRILDYCQHVIALPGESSLNVAVAGSIVLYDRIIKS